MYPGGRERSVSCGLLGSGWPRTLRDLGPRPRSYCLLAGSAGRWTPHVNVLTANLWLLLWQGADLDRFKAVAKERQSRNVAPHVARDSSAFAEFLEEGKAKGGAKL